MSILKLTDNLYIAPQLTQADTPKPHGSASAA